jgi:hypothetical protein
VTLLEEFVADLNERHFLKEFSFRHNTFVRPGRGTLEVADHVVWIDDLLFVFQLKERTSEETAVERWIERSVLRKATKQIRATLALLEERDAVLIKNDRGHQFDFTLARSAHVFKIVLFQQPQSSIQVVGPRCHVSASVGFIHILTWTDYQQIVKYLVTAIEMADYFAFRESLMRNREPSTIPSEVALIGQYLLDERNSEPSEHFAAALFALLDNRDDFVLNALFDGISQRIERASGGPTGYYRMLSELAKLSRTELAALKERFGLALTAARENRFEMPYRFVAPRTDSGFLIIPLLQEHREQRLVALESLTRAAKYDQRTSRQVGISVVMEGDAFLIDWAFLQSPWTRDLELEEALLHSPPFRPLRQVSQPKYHFSTDRLREHGLS